MKKFFVWASAIILSTSCSSFLDVETLGKSTIEGFFEDTDGLKAAGLGLHRCILTFYDGEYIAFAELAGDNANLIRVNADQSLQKTFDFANLPEDNSGAPYQLWKKGYTICTNANNILHYAPKLLEKFPQEEELIRKHMGYAYFSRALAIFDLCNVFAQTYDYTPDAGHLGVVAIDYIPGFDDNLSRHTVKQCYDHIIDDLEKALECFGPDDEFDPYYISERAVKALFARVYLYMKDYGKAASYAAEAMAGMSLTPASDYVRMYRKAQDLPGEGILRMNSYDAGTSMRAMCSPTGNQKLLPTDEFMASFAEGDVRKELFHFVGEAEDGAQYEGREYTAICKYLPVKAGVSSQENRRCDHFILRLSEMYLIHAEALCLGGGDLSMAADDLVAVKARALGVDKSKVKLSYNSAADLDRLVQEERRKELCFEGHRFFDLKRRGESVVRPAGTTSTMMRVDYPSYLYALPICQLEMQANEHMVQNEGYPD